MTMVIYNPTDWTIVVKWNGLDHTFKPDERKPVEDSMGRQVIHNYAARGLVELIYGDEGEKELQKAEEGRRRCDEFWTKQIENINQLNLERKEGNKPYLRPQPDVVMHAKRLGHKIIEPYKLVDSSSEETKLLIEQNRELRLEITKKDSTLEKLQNQIEDLTSKFQSFMALAGAQQPQGDNGGKDFDPEIIKATYNKMSRKNFVKWVVNNWEEIQSYPQEIRDGIAVKHENMFGAPLPEDKPEVETYGV